MQPKFIRIKELASTPERQGVLPVSAPTLWRWVRDGKFPQPVRLGPQVTAWSVEAVESWQQERMSLGRGRG